MKTEAELGVRQPPEKGRLDQQKWEGSFWTEQPCR